MPTEAIITDIHGNLEALETVLAHIDAREDKVDRIVCLGDVVGYGPDPVACLETVMDRCEFCLMGNHEWAVLHGGDEDFNPIAQEALRWTRDQIQETHLREYMSQQKSARLEGEVLYVHASVKDPLLDYVREADSPESFREACKTLQNDFKFFNLCFTGHNHRTFLVTEEGFIYPHEEFKRFHVSHAKLYVCVGSVGQPRDEDPRASYVIHDGETVEYVRLEYDIETTAEKILNHGLNSFLAQRLFHGH